MKNTMRSLSVIFALCGMTFAILFPVNNLHRVTAAEETPMLSEIIKPSVEQVEQQLGKTPVEFEENRGQFDKRVRFMARAAGSTVFLTADEVVYVLPMVNSRESKIEDIRANDEDQTPTKMFALRMKLVGANADSTFAGEETVEHRTNYFKGLDKVNWQTDVPNHASVRYESVYDGIGMIWHGKQNGETQYDFVVNPNADAGQISLKFDGADNLEIDADGNLLIHTPAGIVKQNKPYTFQETDGIRQEIESRFILSEPSAVADSLTPKSFNVKFNIGNYDRSKTLTIDPTVNLSNLAYSTFLGGSNNDQGTAIAVDSVGNTYITGSTRSASYPTTAGTFDPTHNGGDTDVFVTKLNADGSGLIYSTFIGGSDIDYGNGIAIDSSGNAYIIGYTRDAPTDYPVTGGAFDTTNNGGIDVFVTKLNASGSGLIYSTFIGGSDTDFGTGIAIDSTGNAYLTGYTVDAATDYPTTGGAFDTTHNGDNDVFVTKLNASGSGLIYSTFLGGSSAEQGTSIAIDSSGNAYLTGYAATDYPTTGGAFDTTHNGGFDVFVTKLNASGSGLIYSTFIGGGSDDRGYGIAIDSTGNAYLTGWTRSSVTGYPTTGGAFDTTHNGGTFDVFVTKLNASGSGLIYSTFIGGGSDDFGNGIAIDSSGNAYLTGYTSPTDYPTTVGAFDRIHNGGDDVFVTKISGSFAPADFDGDGKTDISIFRPAPGEWWYSRSSDGGNRAFQFGNSADKIVPADFTGDGKTDVAIWRPSSGEWFVLRSEDFSFYSFPFGTSGDTPVVGDFDADGKADAGVFRSSTLTWYISKSSGGTIIQQFGATGDKPVPADYDGDGKADIAIFRANGANGAEWWINRSSNQTVFALSFGASTDKAVPGDYTGDGKADVAFWRPSNGNWFVLRSEDFSFFAFPFGTTNDVPVAGDYDGDGKFDAGVFRPSSNTWFIQRSTAGTLIQQFGIAGDLPVPNAFVP